MEITSDLQSIFKDKKIIIGMVHLPALPGSIKDSGSGLDSIVEKALKNAEALINGGVNGIMIENAGDMSFSVVDSQPETIASMAIITREVRNRFPKIPLGINILIDYKGAIAVAHATNAEFVRVASFAYTWVSPGGIAVGAPNDLLRYRKFLDSKVKIFADVYCKNGAPLVDRPIEEVACDTARFQADSIIITGKSTGQPVSLEELKKVRDVLPHFPILVGSGTDERNIEEVLKYADGAIIGTSFLKNRNFENGVDVDNVRKVMNMVNKVVS